MSFTTATVDFSAAIAKLKPLFGDDLEAIRSLAPETVNVLLAGSTTPFATQMDYIGSYIALFDIKKRLFELKTLSQQVLIRSTLAPEQQASALQLYLRLLQHIEESIQTRLGFHRQADVEGDAPLLPRLRRLGNKTGCTEKEQTALVFCIAVATEGFLFALRAERDIRSGNTYEHALLQWYCDMSARELTEFLRPNRIYVKQGIITPDEDDPLRYSLSVPYTSVTILVGTKMDESERLKVADTVLAEVLQEEGIVTSAEFVEEVPADAGAEKDESEDIFEFLRNQVTAEEKGLLLASGEIPNTGEDDLKDDAPASSAAAGNEEEVELKAYTTDIEYLSEHFDWLGCKARIMSRREEMAKDYDKDPKEEAKFRELVAKERMLRAKCKQRTALLYRAGSKWKPRLERLAKKLVLDDFEKYVIVTLAGAALSSKIAPDMSRYSSRRGQSFDVGGVIRLFAENFEEEIGMRKYFYKKSKLVNDGIIKLQDNWGSDLSDTTVELDRRMLDFVVGLDTEINELVEGSHLYAPAVDIDQVVLPPDQKQLILDTCQNFDKFSKARKDLGFDDIVTYGKGLLLLFYGKSGTGKTMMANAVGKKLGKKILLINYPSLGDMNADLVLKFIFREAKMQDALLFFDECESIFISRDYGRSSINLLLTEIERHPGLMIMATNRAFDLDEAMHRRITLAVEFKNPDVMLREVIWRKHIPAQLKINGSIDWKYLSLRYELTGGFIKNAIMSALSKAVARDPKDVAIEQADLEEGAIHQLRGRLQMTEFDRRVVPRRGLDSVLCDEKNAALLREVVDFEKARQVLRSDWGFDANAGFDDMGTICLFHGRPGTGKTLAAKAIGFETGRPLKIINTGELVSKYVGETGRNIESIFKEAKATDAILVFDEAEGLFGARSERTSSSTDRYANMDTGLLLYHIENFDGIIILTTNLLDAIDPAFFRRFRFVIGFELPDEKTRGALWRSHLPKQAPLAADVDFAKLGARFKFGGGNIKNVCWKAAARAALRPKREITMDDLMSAGEQEEKAAGQNDAPAGLYV